MVDQPPRRSRHDPLGCPERPDRSGPGRTPEVPPVARPGPTVPGSGPVQRERRDVGHQAPLVDGQRASDPRWKPRDIADRLGVTPGFIVAEIREGRLEAVVIERPDRNAVYRISDDQFAAYCRRFLWTPQPPRR